MLQSYWQTIQMAAWNLTHRLGPADVIDILIVTALIYEGIMLVRQTRSSAVLKGVLLLLAATALSNILGLTAMQWLLNHLLEAGALVLIVLFQPELRKALEQAGRGRLFGQGHETDEDTGKAINEIIQCMMDLSRRRVGALIVIEQKTGLKDIIETGTQIDGRVTAPLLENIFEPNTPLHDGAVIVRGTRVIAGACILPLTDNQGVNRELGTRHRAAIGVSETTDAVALIVSEETGIMSVAREGRLSRHMDSESLRAILESLYEQPTQGWEALRRHRKEAE